jgi:hypothetical protein
VSRNSAWKQRHQTVGTPAPETRQRTSCNRQMFCVLGLASKVLVITYILLILLIFITYINFYFVRWTVEWENL